MSWAGVPCWTPGNSCPAAEGKKERHIRKVYKYAINCKAMNGDRQPYPLVSNQFVKFLPGTKPVLHASRQAPLVILALPLPKCLKKGGVLF